ncbi:MAG TPA: glycoside hydrolase family 43 protein [Arachnia sp.]|nr:glycoside hydrolase family 43 protein [Arachnia sp.]
MRPPTPTQGPTRSRFPSRLHPRRVLIGAGAMVLSAALLGTGLVAGPQAFAAPPVIPAPDGSLWTDATGGAIKAHGGSVVSVEEAEVQLDITGDGALDDRVFLWYGEDKTNATRPVDGVRGYWSTDLATWNDMGLVLPSHQFFTLKAEGGAVSVDSTKVATVKATANKTAPDAGSTQAEIDAAKAFVAPYVETWADEEAGVAATYDEAALANASYRLNGNINIMERPKMLWNAKTRKFVIIYHADGPLATDTNLVRWVTEGGDPADRNIGSRYSRAEIGFAVSDTPWGPFKLVNTTKMNWATGVPNAGREGDSRDMTVFQDTGEHDVDPVADDAYAVYSSEMNQWMYVSRLNAEYTGPLEPGNQAQLGEDFSNRVLPDYSREASSVFKYDGWYYMITSGTDGWNSTPVLAYRSRSMITPTEAVVGNTGRHPSQGQWERLSPANPCIGAASRTGVGTADPSKCFDSQPTFAIPLDQEAGQFIYMGDRWRVDSGTGSAGEASRYVWAPIQIDTATGQISVENVGAWDPSDATLYRPVRYAGSGPLSADIAERGSFAPAFDVTVGDTLVEDVTANWDPASLDAAFSAPGSHTVAGHIADGPLAGRYVSTAVEVTGAPNICREPGAQLSASFHQTQYSTLPVGNACDGNSATTWSTWASGGASPASVTMTLTAPRNYAIDHVSFTNVEGVIASVGVEYRDPATGSWLPTTATAATPAANNSLTTVAFDEVEATGLRLTFATPGSYLKITEAYFPGAAPALAQATPPVIGTTPGVVPALPLTVRVVQGGSEETDAPVVWDVPDPADLATEFEKAEIHGTAELDGRTVAVTATVWVVPERVVYLIDTGRVGANGSEIVDAARALRGDALLNDAADRKVTAPEDSWGYIERNPSDNQKVSVTPGNAADWATSYTGDDNDADEGLVYRMTLDPGEYRIVAAHVPRRTQTHGSWLNVNGQKVDEKTVAVTQMPGEVRPPVFVTHELSLTERTTISYETQKLQASGGYNAHVSLLAAVRVDDETPALAIEPSATTRCVAGKVVVAVTARNADEAVADVTLASAFGGKEFADLQPGTARSAAFTTRAASIGDGSVAVSATATDGRVFEATAPYPATNCG